MKFTSNVVACVVLLACSSAPALAWSPSPETTNNNSRRALLQQSVFGITAAASTILLPQSASAGLLDDYGGTDMKIENKSTKDRAAAVAQPKAVSTLEPNLRSNYYYPTNKKRYLPRIKKCNDAIPSVAEAIGLEEWSQAEEFCSKVADDTILPMRLYTSSLLGGGTNVKVAFAEDMKKASSDFEKAQKKLSKAIAKKDRESSSKALEDLASALQLYRESGRLTGPDGMYSILLHTVYCIDELYSSLYKLLTHSYKSLIHASLYIGGGDIPSVDEIRRSACRVQGRSFEQKIKDRDARLKGEVTVASSK